MTDDRITVTCGDLTLAATRNPDVSLPVYNVWTTSAAIDGGLGVEATKTDRIGDGAVLSGWRRPGRELTLGGVWFGPGEAEARAFMDGLSAIGAAGQAVEVRRTTGVGQRWCVAALDGDPKLTAVIEDDWARVEWELPLYAADPCLYGDRRWCQARTMDPDAGLVWPLFDPDGELDWGEVSGLSTGLLANAGTVDAWPVVTLTGNAASGAAVGDGLGREVVYRGPIAVASPVTLDFASGRATVRGGDVTELVTGRGWWSVPPGGGVAPTVRSLQPGVTLVADITTYDTYI